MRFDGDPFELPYLTAQCLATTYSRGCVSKVEIDLMAYGWSRLKEKM